MTAPEPPSSDAFRLSGEERLIRVLSDKGRPPFDFQRETWAAFLDGRSGLVHAPTGVGKTLAVLGGPLIRALERGRDEAARGGLSLLWLTPLRALAADTAGAIAEAADDLGLGWTVGVRTGDTGSAERRRQDRRPPAALVATPESLAVWCSHEATAARLATLDAVVVDEWHELMGSKRGVMTELLLARVRRRVPGVPIWGLSATLANPGEAMAALLGPSSRHGRLVRGRCEKATEIHSVLPDAMERFPWAGHLGLHLLPAVVEAVGQARTSLVFTNTRAQAERWYRALLDAGAPWADRVGLHHGSVADSARRLVEAGLAEGRLKAAVCTSSLDLGVDFSPVDQVIQIGSPKGIARLLQRAGRSGHGPGRVSRIRFVPTHAFELAEIAAVRRAVSSGRMERRIPLEAPLDVLAQHMVTLALGGGFEADALFVEIQKTNSYRNFTKEEFNWLLSFVATGGTSLSAYPEYRRVERVDGRCRMTDRAQARRHRMNIGTIGDDPAVQVAYRNGVRLGTVEEAFAARLSRGDRFLFGGKVLEVVRLRDATLQVRKARSPSAGVVPRWMGGRMPLSTDLSEEVRRVFHQAASGDRHGDEMAALEGIFRLQGQWSHVPSADEVLIESLRTREGFHLFLFPFEGRGVHEGLAALFAHRISRRRPMTLSFAVNDYGMELLADRDLPPEEALAEGLFSTENLTEDLQEAVNAAELARRHFREIARISGLVASRFPGRRKSAAQLQASSGLLFDVLNRYDPENRLLAQARFEVLETRLEHRRLAACLERIASSRCRITRPPRVTPLAFPIMVDRLRASISSEKLLERLQRLLDGLNRAADAAAPGKGAS